MRAGLAVFLAVFLGLAAGVRGAAETKPAAPSEDTQYVAVATARNHAETALRHNRLAFESGQVQWTAASLALDQIKLRIGFILDKAVAVEMRRDETDRDATFLDDLRDRRLALDDQWLRFMTNERARMEREFHRAVEITTALNAANLSLIALEHSYKELGMNLSTICTSFDELAAKADDAHDMGAKALTDLLAARKMWEDIQQTVSTVAATRARAGKP